MIGLGHENELLWNAGPQSDSSFETLARAVTAWQERLQAGLSRSIEASDQTMGHPEVQILHKTQEVERAVLVARGGRINW